MGMDTSQVDAVGVVPCLIVDLSATYHEAVGWAVLNGLNEGMIDFDRGAWLEVAHHFFGDMEEGIVRHHHIASAWQRTTDGLVGLAAHDDGVAFGRGLEVLQVGTQVPGHRALVADGVVLGCCDDDVHALRFLCLFSTECLFLYGLQGTYWTRYAHRANPEGLWSLFSTDFRDFGDFATRFGSIPRVYGVFLYGLQGLWGLATRFGLILRGYGVFSLRTSGTLGTSLCASG